MKRIKRIIVRFFALLMTVILIVGVVLGGCGYKMYHDALAEQPLAEKIAEIQSEPHYTMLKRCREKAEKKGCYIRTVQCDFRKVSACFHETFDCVASSGNSLAYVPNGDVVQTLHEMDRLVSPGGYLYLDTRNWDKILREHQRFYLYNPVFRGEDRINLMQVWDYPDNGTIIFNLLYTFERDRKIFQKEIFEEHYHPIPSTLIFDAIQNVGYNDIEIYPCPAVAKERPLEELAWYAVLAHKK